jgi:predicted RNA-binding protein with EMAP domain
LGEESLEKKIPTPSPIPQEIPEEQKKFLNALNDLLTATQELAFTVALVPPEALEKYSEIKDLIETAKNVVRATYNFYKLVKRVSK